MLNAAVEDGALTKGYDKAGTQIVLQKISSLIWGWGFDPRSLCSQGNYLAVFMDVICLPFT